VAAPLVNRFVFALTDSMVLLVKSPRARTTATVTDYVSTVPVDASTVMKAKLVIAESPINFAHAETGPLQNNAQ
jgi:hypothetical protein